MVGYSHKSLRNKLGIKPGMRVYLSGTPHTVATELGNLNDDTTLVTDPTLANFFLCFITTRSELSTVAETVQHLHAPGQIIWIAWPKKASGVKSEVTEQDLRDALLPIGLVDTKVAAVSTVYSGLKFTWRKSTV